MNLKKFHDNVAPYRKNRVSTKIGKSLADYYRKGDFMKTEMESMSDILKKEREKRDAERTK